MVFRYTRCLHLSPWLNQRITDSAWSALSVSKRCFSEIIHKQNTFLKNYKDSYPLNILNRNRLTKNLLEILGTQQPCKQQSYKFSLNFTSSFCTKLPLYLKHDTCSMLSRNCSTVKAPDAVNQIIHGIQKDVSSLKSKRVVRRKRSSDVVAREQEYFDVVAFATAEEYNLEALKDDIARQGLYEILKLPEDAYDTLHVEAKYRVGNEPREIFFFREGSVVFWNMQEEEQQTILSYIRPYQSGSYETLLIQEELEQFEFTYTGNKTVFTDGEIHLRSLTPLDDRFVQQLEMFAFSNALSLSVKLAIWESSLEKYVNSIEFVLQDLKDGKKIKMSEAAVLRKAGELFTLSHLINLSSDLLDTPDFYWDRDNLEKIYRKTCNHLNISRRTRVMNEKLRQCVELTELLRDHLKDKHHTRLELMIIFLILIEVVFQIFHLLERYYWGVDDEELKNKSKTVD